MVERAAAQNGEQRPRFVVEPKDVLNTKIEDLLGNRFIKKRGETEREREETSLTEEATCEHFEGTKYVGLFFSAEWCPPCQLMMRPLKNFYTDANLEKRQFEIVFVSKDTKKEEWFDHYKQMPWLSLAYDSPKINELQKHFGIVGIPALIILEAKTGFVVQTKGRKDLKEDVKGVFEQWQKLLDLKRVRAVEVAKEDAIAESERLEREENEKRKKAEAERAANEENAN